MSPFFKGSTKGGRRSQSPYSDLHQYELRQVTDVSSSDESGGEEEEEEEAEEGSAEGPAAAQPSGAGSPADAAGSTVTVAPTLAGSQFSTTSLVMTSSSVAPDAASHKRRAVSKADAAHEFVYGPPEEPRTRPVDRASPDLPVAFRANRAQTMRRTCIMKRVKDDEETRARLEEQDSAWTDGNEILDPIVARTVPKAVYGGPKIAIRETKCSKFRYLFNRKPPGVKVYFRPASEDQRKKPPFVVGAAVCH